MNEIFREVDEDYRQEQLLRFLHDNAVLMIATLILAIAVAGGVSWWKADRKRVAEEQTLTLAQAIDQAHDKPATEGRDIMKKAADNLTGGRRVAAELVAARDAATAGDTAGAVALYKAVSDDRAAEATDRDLARIASLSLRLGGGDPAGLSSELNPLAADDSAWRFTAREFQGLLALRQKDTARAKDIFSALAKAEGAPDALRHQASALADVTSLPPDALPVSSGGAP